MTAEEFEASLDRLCELDEPPEEVECADFEPFTAEELAEISQTAADELLAVEAATTGRRGPGQPGSARVFPGESASPAAAFGPGMPLDVLPGCAQLAVAADAAGEDHAFACVSEAELIGVLCAGPAPPGTGFTFTPASRDGPDGPDGYGYGTWRLHTPGAGPDLIVTLESLTTDPCDHRYQARGHDPGAPLRHLSQVRHATCTSPVCRRPASQCDHEHNIPYEAGGRTCLCNTGPKCRHDHRLKQHPRWTVDQLPDGTVRWTTPAGRHYTAEPTQYPI